MGDLDLHLIHGSLGPPESARKRVSWSVQPFLQGSRTWPTDWQTHRQTDHAAASVAECCCDDKVETNWTYPVCFDFVERTKFYDKLIRHCCRFWQQSGMLLQQSRTLLRQCCWCGRGLSKQYNLCCRRSTVLSSTCWYVFLWWRAVVCVGRGKLATNIRRKVRRTSTIHTSMTSSVKTRSRSSPTIWVNRSSSTPTRSPADWHCYVI